MITDVEEIKSACAVGATIRMVMGNPEKRDNPPTYHLSTTGELIGVRALGILKDRMEPVVDGLFPKGPSQNYTLGKEK